MAEQQIQLSTEAGLTAATPFVHLRAKSAYSFGQSVARPADLAKYCSKEGMPAFGLADTDNIFSAAETAAKALDAGIQAIVGCHLSHDPITPNAQRPGRRPFRLPLLVATSQGWHNLCTLMSDAYDAMTGDQPRLPPSCLDGRTAGLIALAGGADSELRFLAAEGRKAEALDHLSALLRHFGDRLYIEIQRHGTPEEQASEALLIKLADDARIPLVATAEILYGKPEDAPVREMLDCIISKRTIDDPDRNQLPDTHHFASAEEMAERFADLPDAVANTSLVAQRCSYLITKEKPRLPSVAPDEAQTLRAKAREGLSSLFPQGIPPGYSERLEHEADVIIRCGFPGYFLIVAEYVAWARHSGIPVGPGRGSGAGSLVAWALRITDLDPVANGLLFERFLNSERVSLPDFDVDFCQDRRAEVFNFISQRFGEERVAKIVTFQRMQARAAIRDAGRALGMPMGLVERVAKAVPQNPSKPITLTEAVEAVPDLKALIESDRKAKRLVHNAIAIEGLPRNPGAHAAGVVIADRPLRDAYPTFRPGAGSERVTQMSMKYVEDLGLVKFDVLGLRNLSIIEEARQMVLSQGQPDPLPLSMTLDDDAAYALMRAGDTEGIFQLAGGGITRECRNLGPEKFDDVVALTALYRPGPMENIPAYIACKKGYQQPDYMHPLLEDLLKPTYGILIYQEQVMRAGQILAGYSLGEADLLRRAMGKKIKAEMDAQEERFLKGCATNGIDADLAREIFRKIERFANYGFNKSHAAAYSVISYQTAWFKAKHPAEFMVATLNSKIGEMEHQAAWAGELRRAGVDVRPPCVNASSVRASIEHAPGTPAAARIGLGCIANLGIQAAETITRIRTEGGPFKDIEDFGQRIGRNILRNQIEQLARAGALDSLEPDRAWASARATAAAAANATANQQDLLFGSDAAPPVARPTPWTPAACATQERETIGFTFSANPLSRLAPSAKALGIVEIDSLADHASSSNGSSISIWGTVDSTKKRTTKTGNKEFAILTITDPSGTIEITAFDNPMRDILSLKEGDIAIVQVKPSFDQSGQLRLRAFRARPASAEIASRSEAITIRIPTTLERAGHQAIISAIQGIHTSLTDLPEGRTRISLEIDTRTGPITIDLPRLLTLPGAVVQALAEQYTLVVEKTFTSRATPEPHSDSTEERQTYRANPSPPPAPPPSGPAIIPPWMAKRGTSLQR